MQNDRLENSKTRPSLERPTTIDSRFVYTGERRRYVSFPLGGIGTGSVSLTGSGRLTDWSIRNRPAIHQFNGYSHFAIKAEHDGTLHEAFACLGAVRVTAPRPGRRRCGTMRTRRPRFLMRRKAGRTGAATVHREREIIARN